MLGLPETSSQMEKKPRSFPGIHWQYYPRPHSVVPTMKDSGMENPHGDTMEWNLVKVVPIHACQEFLILDAATAR